MPLDYWSTREQKVLLLLQPPSCTACTTVHRLVSSLASRAGFSLAGLTSRGPRNQAALLDPPISLCICLHLLLSACWNGRLVSHPRYHSHATTTHATPDSSSTLRPGSRSITTLTTLTSHLSIPVPSPLARPPGEQPPRKIGETTGQKQAVRRPSLASKQLPSIDSHLTLSTLPTHCLSSFAISYLHTQPIEPIPTVLLDHRLNCFGLPSRRRLARPSG